MPRSRESLLTRFALCGAVLFSLAFAFWPDVPSPLGFIGLVLMPVIHVYLPGWLLLRWLRIEHGDHPVVAFAWVAGTGLAFSIVAGGLYRFVNFPVEAYVLSVHGVMLGLSLFLPQARVAVDWPDLRRNWPMYLCMLLLCALALGIGIDRSQLRYSGWEDQTVFIAVANWLANDPPYPLEIRQVGLPVVEKARWVVDGWTYQHAVWAWSTGVPASTLIWHWLTPLFAWMTPLVAFALGYELSNRKTHAFYAMTGFMIAAVLTLDSLVYIPHASTYGQNMLAQLNTLRMFSTAIMTPLTLLIGLSFLKSPQKSKALVLLVALIAVAFLHSRQIVMMAVLLSLAAALLTLRTRKKQLYASLVTVALILAALAVPLLQRQSLVQRTESAGVSMGGLPVDAEGELGDDVMAVVVSGDIPADRIFYHPIILVALVLGIGGVILGPRRLETQFIGVVCVAVLAVFFAPGVSQLFMKLVTPRVAPGFILMLPLGLIFGTFFDSVLRRIPLRSDWRFGLGAAITMALVGVFFFEPIPITASGKDQLVAMHTLQADRRQLAADRALVARFNAEIGPLPGPAVVMAPNRINSYIVEDVAYTLMIGGRSNENPVQAEQYMRFYMQGRSAAPFLGTGDFDLLQRHDTRYVVMQADDVRLPMLLMQPQRFEKLFAESGYTVFAVLDLTPDALSDHFEAMNDLFVEGPSLRWLRGDFDLRQPGDSGWEAVAENWREVMATEPSDLAAYGLAASLLLAGDDAEALPYWQDLAQAYPESALLHQAAGHSLRQTGDANAARDHLLAALNDIDAGTQAVITRTLLQEMFFYTLDAAQVETLLGVIEAQPMAWELLAVYDNPAQVRRSAMLLLSAGYKAAALQALEGLSPTRVTPGDVITRALLEGEGDPVQVLTVLEPYLDFDHYVTAYHTQRDRWEPNTVAGFYHLLRGNLAQDTGDYAAAQAAYEQAIAQGLDVAGEWFLVELALAAGDFDSAEAAISRLEQSEALHAGLWALSAAYQVALVQDDAEAIAQAQDALAQYAAEHALILPAGQVPALRALTSTLLPQNAFIGLVDCCVYEGKNLSFRVQWLQQAYVEYPENEWHALIFDEATYQRYAELDLPALWVMGAVVDWPFSLSLEGADEAGRIGIRVNTAHLSVEYAEQYHFETVAP
jgi:tetratricopeptide (TPR) repeat protein